MDKLLLSPDDTVGVDTDTDSIETEKPEIEHLPVISSPSTPVNCAANCLIKSPILNMLPSPKTELLEFLTFHKTSNRSIIENALLAGSEWAWLPSAFQFETFDIFPPVFSSDFDLLDPEILPQLQNVVVSANLHCKLDLRRIATFAHNAEYNPRRLPALYMRLRKPSALALVFGNGKLVCIGSSSVQLSHRAARMFARIIQKLGFPVQFTSYKVENLIVSCEVKFHIRLELFELLLHSHCVYEPELFPGLFFRLGRSHVKILIFSSGRIILSGSRYNFELQKSFRKIYPLLKLFEKKV